MGFRYPSGLILAAAAAGVTLLLWMLRRLHQDQLTSSTYLWQKLLADLYAAAPWRRLRRELLLALQLLAIAALGLALARPYRAAGPAPGRHLLLVIDTSASMQATPGGGPPLLELARARGLELAAAALAEGGRVTAIAAGPAPSLLVDRARDQAAVGAALDGLAVGPAGADLAAAVSLAAAIGRGEPGARCVVLTDRPLSGWAGLPVAPGAAGLPVAPGAAGLPVAPGPAGLPVAAGAAGLPVAVEALGLPQRNLAVAALAVAPGDLGAAAVARVVNRGLAEMPYTLALEADGAPAAAAAGTLAAGAAVDLNFTALPVAGGYAARLAEPDDLIPDNVAYAAAGSAGPLQVLLVTRGNLFLDRALGLRPGVRVVQAAPEDYAPGPYGLYVLDGWLPDELPPGPLLLVNPPAGAGPMPLGAQEVQVTRVLPGPDAAEWLPVPVDDVAVAAARALRPPAGARVLMTSPETPLAAAAEVAGRRVAVLAFDLHQSDLPLRPAFPVLVQNLLGWMAPPAPAPAAVEAGRPVPLDLDPLITAAEVIAPDGTAEPVAGEAYFTGADRPGVYRLVQHRAGGDRVHTMAVNFPRAESTGAGDSAAAAAAALEPGPAAGAGLAPAGDAATGLAPAGDAATGLPRERELWMYLAWAAIALLAAEWWVYSRGG